MRMNLLGIKSEVIAQRHVGTELEVQMNNVMTTTPFQLTDAIIVRLPLDSFVLET